MRGVSTEEFKRQDQSSHEAEDDAESFLHDWASPTVDG